MYFSLPTYDIATCQEPIKLNWHGPPIYLTWKPMESFPTLNEEQLMTS